MQKQPPEAFYKKRCSQIFCKIHRKTPAVESLFKSSCMPEALCNWKNFDVQPKTNTKNPKFESMGDLGKFMS